MEAKKLAKKAILRLQKSGRDGIDEEYNYTFEIKTKVFHNTWRLALFINMAKNPKWYHLATCCVESEQGTKDYYIVRGFSDNRPYYIKISAHAIFNPALYDRQYIRSLMDEELEEIKKDMIRYFKFKLLP